MTHEMALPEEAKSTHDHAAWLEDVRRWRSEHRQALVNLTKLQMAILQHDVELESYANQIRSHEEHLREYETAQCESGFHDFDKLEARRLKLAAMHNQRRQEYDQTRARHVKALAEIETLLRGVFDFT